MALGQSNAFQTAPHNICLGRLHILDHLAEISFFQSVSAQSCFFLFPHIAETSDKLYIGTVL